MAPDTATDSLAALIEDARQMQVAGLPRPRLPRTIDLTRVPHAEIHIPAATISLLDDYADYGA